ncbi:MAG TPA: hypothetical protein VN132_05785, partial [Bdellovibrio sp.]|nr:hypothetical protein [Bdellovibrio sp.]
LIDELQILRHRHNRITGSFRFDMAIVGPPDQHHPPYLLEINEIGFDGLARSSFFQKVLLENMPTLRHRLRSLDTAAAEVRNMQRLGNKIARIQYDSYNWDEEYLVQTAERKGAKIHLVCPKQFGLDVDSEEFPLLGDERLKIINNRVAIGDLKPDAVNMSFAFTLKDYQENHSLYSRIVQSKTPQYGPFLTGLVASKSILTLLADKELRKKLLGSSASLESSILPAHILSEDGSLEKPREWVLKHADGYGGLHVFMNEDLEKQLKKIPPRRRHEWILQKKTELNLINVNGLLSRPKKAISDLGVFVHYDWSQGRFLNFEMGGLMCRATNRSLKVNVSSGGLQAAVFLDRSA